MSLNWDKIKRALGRWEYHVGIWGIILTVALIVGVVFFREEFQQMEQYGYLGAFLISIFGGATVIIPIPMTPVIFALGAVMKPSLAPYLGPVFVGTAAALGETIGGLIIYMVGYGGGAAVGRENSKAPASYLRMQRWVEKRGSLAIFLLAAVVNPFFYPTALAAGVLHFELRKFLLVCWAGKMIKCITVASLGYWGLGSLLRMFGVSV